MGFVEDPYWARAQRRAMETIIVLGVGELVDVHVVQEID
jgi:hypothetical protein